MNRLLLFALALSAAVFAQTTPTVATRPLGVTTLTLAADIANGIVAPLPGSRVRVPPLERVTLLVPESWTSPIQWTKNGKPIADATSRSYLIPLATTSDSGIYTITGAPFPTIATAIALEVVLPGHLGNFSTRTEIAAGATTPQIIAFVVNGTAPKSLLVRAVGPSLKQFGVTKPVAQPQLRFFDAAGREILLPNLALAFTRDAFFASVGAFPLLPGERDTFDYGEFRPGAYTVQVSDFTNQGGTVLVEVYEFSPGSQPSTSP